MRSLCSVMLMAAVTLLASAPSRATPTDYSPVERCLGPGGPNATYAKWVGSADSSISFISQTQLNLALEVGKDRTAQGGRNVNVFKLKRGGDSGLLTPAPAERDDIFPDVLELVMTNEVDSYLLEFVPTQPAGAKESCVLTFGNVWTWASRPGSTFPHGPRRESFTAERLNMTGVKQLLYKGQDGAPQRLRLEPIKDGTAPMVPVVLLDDDPGSPVEWDGKSNTIRTISNAPLYNLWLCSPGAALSSHPTCLGLMRYELNNDPLIVRTRSDVGMLKQTASIRGLTNGQLNTYALLGSPAATSARTYEYGGSPQAAGLTPGLAQFVTSERDIEYVLTLVGSADAERSGRRCPADLAQQPNQIRIYSGGSSSAFDVNGCLYQRDNVNTAWQLVPDSPDGDAPEQRLLNSMRFSLCTAPNACVPAGTLGARTQLGFRLLGRGSSLVLQASGVPDAPMPLEPQTVTLATVKPVYLPRLPSASVTETEVAHIDLKTFDKAEWDAQRKATCIEGEWKKQYGADVLDVGATLLLRAGPTQTTIGDGRWRVVATDQKELLCPELSDAQVTQLLASARTALLGGQTAEVDAVQGGQLVGRHVMLQGPPRAPIAGVELHVSKVNGGGVLFGFRRHEPLEALGSICALTEADWGDRLTFDPTQLALRGDHGETLLTFRSQSPSPQRHPFVRPATAPRTPDGKLWRYCAPVAVDGAPDATAIAVTRVADPGIDVEEITLTLEDAQGCVAGGVRGPCARLDSSVVATASGTHAMSALHAGVAWGRAFSTSGQVPNNEVRVYLAAPLAYFEVHPPGWFTFATELGVHVGFTGARGVVGETLTTRAAVPIGFNAALCVSGTGMRPYLHFSPQLCVGAFGDALSFQTTATSAAPSAKLGVDGPAFVPFVSLALGEF
jgi:hypothetical protein